mmetsp:Transcript_36404/g.102624  ORF Transcript_36404/g.102624 Transcript_36404/m.102624 type:complete len:203 (-) Transcript_36404:236-844(-)
MEGLSQSTRPKPRGTNTLVQPVASRSTIDLTETVPFSAAHFVSQFLIQSISSLKPMLWVNCSTTGWGLGGRACDLMKLFAEEDMECFMPGLVGLAGAWGVVGVWGGEGLSGLEGEGLRRFDCLRVPEGLAGACRLDPAGWPPQKIQATIFSKSSAPEWSTSTARNRSFSSALDQTSRGHCNLKNWENPSQSILPCRSKLHSL